jgi:hypothetical protein
MLWKLSLTGIKGRMRDYIVLFSGLVMASAIFYMFESMASNEAFLESNSTVASTVIDFSFRIGVARNHHLCIHPVCQFISDDDASERLRDVYDA